LVKGRRGPRLLQFHDLEKGEWPAILRPKEIRISVVLPKPETVSRHCVRAKQSEIELFSANARQEAVLLASNPVNFLEARF
jgi:hypothetical protein